MRRAIAATVMGGLVLGGAVATPSVAAARGHGDGNGPGQARQAAPAKARAESKSKADSKSKARGKPKADGKSATGMKTVAYEGYEFQVPASWPVYRLDEHPQTCVRYDVHAVYLGTPGPDMRCPAGLVGQTQTVSFIPGRGTAAGPAAGSSGHAVAPAAAGGTELQRLPAVHGTVTQNAVRHQLEVALGATKSGATVLGTYGTNQAAVEQVLSTLHLAPAGTAPTVQSAPVPPPPGGTSQRAKLSSERAPVAARRAATGAPGQAGASPASTAAEKAPAPAYTNWHGVPAHWPVEIVSPSPSPSPPRQPKPPPTPVQPVSGFDTCGAPPVPTMRAWRSAYAAIGVYIGGANVGCQRGNLSAGWVQTVASMGWGLLPTYVGLQAPCWGGQGALIDPGNAVAEGSAAAADAVSDAKAVGLAAGSPIYYDMEAYNGGGSCRGAVLNFLGAWDSQVAAAGYVTGVYSSQASGIVDMQAAAVGRTAGFTPPDAIWIALWDNVSSLSDGNLTWPLTDRAKQYAGNVNQTIGGVTMNIDRDLVGGPVAGGPVDGLPTLSTNPFS
jgi:Domain of unknown function (DUF1906)